MKYFAVIVKELLKTEIIPLIIAYGNADIVELNGMVEL